MVSLLFFAFLAGIFTVLSPCILPILPAILAVGVSEGSLRPLGVVIGLIISFSFFTLFLTSFVHLIGVPAEVFRYVAIALLFLFGLIMVFPSLSTTFSRFTAPLAYAGYRIQRRHVQGKFLSGCLFGFALGLVWTPCAGPILAAIITLVATQPISLFTVWMTLTYSMGAGIPLFCIAYGGYRVVESSRWLSSHAEVLRRVFGGLLIFMSLAIALQWDLVLQRGVTIYFPTVLIEDNPLVQDQIEKLRAKSMLAQGKAPELVGIAHWIHSPPLSLEAMRGKVVLIDFWTYSCINCLRTLPHIEKWWTEYQDKGLVIIGVHTPEFEFEKDFTNVEKAAKTLGITYPIAQDNLYATWSAFGNRYWPAHYLIDQEGYVRYVHFGEGDYVETENAIRNLLGLSALNDTAVSSSTRPLSPETYLGTQRAAGYTRELRLLPGRVIRYRYQTPLKAGEVGLKGPWKVESERITAEGEDSYLEGLFLAKQIHLVLSGASPVPLQIRVDGKLVQEIVINEDRKYDIFNGAYGLHAISLKIPRGVSAYAFTFGDDRSLN